MDSFAASKNRYFVRLARSSQDVEAAQSLRHHIFRNGSGRDADDFDAVSDHLLVINGENTTQQKFAVADGFLTGTYRLMHHGKAAMARQFYSSREYDLQPLLERKPQLSFLELGRSCVLPEMRDQPVVELLWQGIWNYVRHHRIDVMMGCASFPGTDPEVHAEGLSYLAHKALAPEEWRVNALPERYIEMKRRSISSIDERSALRALPPLIKGYVRLGCHVGEGAVIDTDFNTTDVLIILPVAAINPRYFAYFGPPTS